MTDQEARAYTEEEVRDELLRRIRAMAMYWAALPRRDNPYEKTETQWKCDGLAFSILAALDGCSMGIPMFKLVASPHPEDKQFHLDEGENWIEPGTTLDFMLHEYYSSEKNQDTPPLKLEGSVTAEMADGVPGFAFIWIGDKKFTADQVRHALTLYAATSS